MDKERNYHKYWSMEKTCREKWKSDILEKLGSALHVKCSSRPAPGTEQLECPPKEKGGHWPECRGEVGGNPCYLRRGWLVNWKRGEALSSEPKEHTETNELVEEEEPIGMFPFQMHFLLPLWFSLMLCFPLPEDAHFSIHFLLIFWSSSNCFRTHWGLSPWSPDYGRGCLPIHYHPYLFWVWLGQF